MCADASMGARAWVGEGMAARSWVVALQGATCLVERRCALSPTQLFGDDHWVALL